MGRTAVGTGKEYLFDIGLLPSCAANAGFARVGGTSRRLLTFGVRLLQLGFPTGTEGRDKVNTAFVESQCTAEV